MWCGTTAKPNDADLAAFQRAFEVVRLIAGHPVFLATTPVQRTVAAYWSSVVTDTKIDAPALRKTFNTEMGSMLLAMRVELGTTPIAESRRGGDVQTLP